MTWPKVHQFLISLLKGTDAEKLAPPSPEDPGWDDIMRQAAQQLLTPIVYRWLQASGWDSQLPLRLIDPLRASVFRLAARNLLLAEELASILREFDRGGLACMPLRGPALAEQLYGELTTRPMGDLDLLIRRESLSDVEMMLSGLGFVEMDRRPGFSRSYSYTLKFIKDQHGWIIVEPHWTIAYPPFADRVDMDAVWKRSVRGRAVGRETWQLSPADLLLHLCFHLIHRGEQAPLLWYYELDRLLRQDQAGLDWSEVVLVARQTGQELLVNQVLEKVHHTFQTPIPKTALSQLSQPTAPGAKRSVAGWAESRLARLMINESNVDGVESFALLLTIKGMRAKLKYAFALLFPSPTFMVLQYGLPSRRSLGLWYLRRVGRFTWEGLKGIVSLLTARRPADHMPRP